MLNSSVSVMERETSIGVKSGAIAGLVFPSLWLLAQVAPFGPQLYLHTIIPYLISTNLLFRVLPTSLLISALFFGFIIFSVVTACLGAGLGFVYIKIRARLPFRSTYLKSLFLGVVMYLLYSSPRLVEWNQLDPYLLAAVVMDALSFAYTFNRF